jgi:hypothetical protein
MIVWQGRFGDISFGGESVPSAGVNDRARDRR